MFALAFPRSSTGTGLFTCWGLVSWDSDLDGAERIMEVKVRLGILENSSFTQLNNGFETMVLYTLNIIGFIISIIKYLWFYIG